MTYQWKHNNTLLEKETSTVLNIRNVQISNVGEYYCIVTAKNNATVVSDVAHLSVHGMIKMLSIRCKTVTGLVVVIVTVFMQLSHRQVIATYVNV